MAPPTELSAEAVDELVEKMVALVPKLGRARKSVVAQLTAELNMLQPFAAARDVMMAALSDRADKDRSRLQAVFGGDCVRITRIRATIEAALTVERFTKDGVLVQCFDACQSVEAVLRDLGLGWQLGKAQKEQKQNLSRRLSQFGVMIPEDVMSAEALGNLHSDNKEDDLQDSEDSEDEKDQATCTRPPDGTGLTDRGPESPASTPTKSDPLSLFKTTKKDTATASPTDHQHHMENLDDFLASQLPERRARSPPSSPPAASQTSEKQYTHGDLQGFHVSIVSEQEINSVTWYHIRLVQDGEERFYQKRYSDFRDLDRALRDAALTRRTKPLTLPSLPEPGLLGLRHALHIGHFNERRFEGLQHYLQDILAQVLLLSDEPPLEEFFSRQAAKCISFQKNANLDDGFPDNLR